MPRRSNCKLLTGAVCAVMTVLIPVVTAQSDAQVNAIDRYLSGKRFLVSYREGGAVYGTHIALDVHYCANGHYLLGGESRRQTVMDNWQVNRWEDAGRWSVLRVQGTVGIRAVSQSGKVDFFPAQILPGGQLWVGEGVSVQPRGAALCR